MKFSKNEKKWIKIMALLTLAVFALNYFGYIDLPFLPAQSGYDTGGDTDVTYEVYAKITTRVLLSKSTTDIAVNMYDMDGNFIDTVTTSSGVATFGMMLEVGRHVQLQGRPAAPATADPYITSLTEWVVPTAGESADTVSLRNVATGESIMWLRDVGSSAPTFTVRNGFDNHTLTGTAATSYLNTTDDAIKVTLTVATANTYYGGESFTDMETGKVYLGGVWFVWQGTVTQDFTDFDYTISDPTNIYYIWKLSDGIYYDSDGDIAAKSVTALITLQSGSTFTADSSISLDCYDLMWLNSGDISSSACFINGGSIDVTAVASKIA